MADFVFNIAAGKVAEYAARVLADDPVNSALVIIPINANAVTDATLKDLDTFAAIEATAANEATGSGWARTTVTNPTVTTDDTNDRQEVDIPDTVLTAVSSATAATDVIVCYDADTTAGTDANLVPLVCLDAAVTPNGGDITFQYNVAGIFRAST